MVEYEARGTTVSALEEQLLERDAILDELKAHLIQAQQRMKLQEDKHRREVEFQVGDYVYLKLQPYRYNHWLRDQMRSWLLDSMVHCRSTIKLAV